MKRVIITGATGFVGANLARRLLCDGHELHLLVRPSYTGWRIKTILDQVKLHKVNLIDVEAVTQLVAKIRPDWIFHLAAHGAYSWQTDLHQMAQTNIIGTMNLVEACLKTGFEAFVNTGSSSEYGFKNHAPTENELPEPNSYYAVTKASATLFCRFVAQSRDVHLPTLRLYSVYGPFEEPRRLLPTLILHGLQGKLPSLVSPDIARDFVYVDDVSEAFLLAATQPQEEPGAVYNVGSGVQISLRQVIDLVRKEMEITVKPMWGSMTDRRWDTSIWKADNRKLTSQLGWQPRYNFQQGFRQMMNWFQNNPTLRQFYETHLQENTSKG